jgi:hypothetical protein
VDAILDAVTVAASEPNVFAVLKSDGPKLYAQVVTGRNVEVPEVVEATEIFGQMIFEAEDGRGAMPALARLVERGEYKVPIRVEVIGKGFDVIESGLDRHMKGVSGTKFVVSL